MNPPNDKQASPVKNLHCTSKCQFNRVLGNRKKLQCSLCMKFYHYKCVDEDPKSTLVWSCFDCRNISQDVQAIKEQMNCIGSKIDSLSQGNVLDMLLTLQKQINILVNEQKSLQSTNADLIHRLHIVTKEKMDLQRSLDIAKSTKAAPLSLENNPIEKPHEVKKSLLIGDSLLRNVRSTDTAKLEILSKSGATYESLTTELSNSAKTYDKIVIVAGTNDCRNTENTTENIKNTSKTLLLEAKKHSKYVVFSSVLPMTDTENSGTQLKIDTVNKNINTMCLESSNCDYVQNDGVFKLSDMTINDALYVRDGYHINSRGAKRLMYNLKLTETTTIIQPTRTYNPMFSYGGTTDPSQRRDNRSQHNKTGYQTSYRCTWCREQDHRSADCPRRGTRVCYHCQSPEHLQRNCPWTNCPWLG